MISVSYKNWLMTIIITCHLELPYDHDNAIPPDPSRSADRSVQDGASASASAAVSNSAAFTFKAAAAASPTAAVAAHAFLFHPRNAFARCATCRSCRAAALSRKFSGGAVRTSRATGVIHVTRRDSSTAPATGRTHDASRSATRAA
jgi:hypothetical protein